MRIVNLSVADALAVLTALPPRAGAMSRDMVQLLREGRVGGPLRVPVERGAGNRYKHGDSRDDQRRVLCGR